MSLSKFSRFCGDIPSRRSALSAPDIFLISRRAWSRRLSFSSGDSEVQSRRRRACSSAALAKRAFCSDSDRSFHSARLASNASSRALETGGSAAKTVAGTSNAIAIAQPARPIPSAMPCTMTRAIPPAITRAARTGRDSAGTCADIIVVVIASISMVSPSRVRESESSGLKPLRGATSTIPGVSNSLGGLTVDSHSAFPMHVQLGHVRIRTCGNRFFPIALPIH